MSPNKKASDKWGSNPDLPLSGRDPFSFIVIGHRGAAGHAPENTLKSMARAVELGAHCIELDVFFVQDTLLVFHDEQLERTTNGRGRLEDQSLRYLRSLNAGDGETIPLLDEVLDLLAGRVGLNVELKGPGTALPTLERLEAHIGVRWTWEHFLLSSARPQEVAAARRRHGGVRIGSIFTEDADASLAQADALDAFSLHPYHASVDAKLVDAAHGRGRKVFAFTVNESRDIARMYDVGVDGVFTDYPDRVLDFLAGC